MTSLIFLAGGLGSRMGAETPKQFILLNQKPVALYSFELFLSCPEVDELIVVCEPAYQYLFLSTKKQVSFALPGARRQDSVYSGLLKSSPLSKIILTHDSARPFVELKYIPPLLEAASRVGSAALGAPVTSTIKQAFSNRLVEKTLDRSNLWEIQTPQALRRDLYFKAFEFIQGKRIEVTDDLSMIEAMGLPSEIVPSTPSNFKLTTPFDLAIAQAYLSGICATN